MKASWGVNLFLIRVEERVSFLIHEFVQYWGQRSSLVKVLSVFVFIVFTLGLIYFSEVKDSLYEYRADHHLEDAYRLRSDGDLYKAFFKAKAAQVLRSEHLETLVFLKEVALELDSVEALRWCIYYVDTVGYTEESLYELIDVGIRFKYFNTIHPYLLHLREIASDRLKCLEIEIEYLVASKNYEAVLELSQRAVKEGIATDVIKIQAAEYGVKLRYRDREEHVEILHRYAVRRDPLGRRAVVALLDYDQALPQEVTFELLVEQFGAAETVAVLNCASKLLENGFFEWEEAIRFADQILDYRDINVRRKWAVFLLNHNQYEVIRERLSSADALADRDLFIGWAISEIALGDPQEVQSLIASDLCQHLGISEGMLLYFAILLESKNFERYIPYYRLMSSLDMAKPAELSLLGKDIQGRGDSKAYQLFLEHLAKEKAYARASHVQLLMMHYLADDIVELRNHLARTDLADHALLGYDSVWFAAYLRCILKVRTDTLVEEIEALLFLRKDTEKYVNLFAWSYRLNGEHEIADLYYSPPPDLDAKAPYYLRLLTLLFDEKRSMRYVNTDLVRYFENHLHLKEEHALLGRLKGSP